MPLTVAERKHRLPHGALTELAAQERDFAISYLSAVMAGEVHPKTERTRLKLRRARRALARKLGVSVAEAFPESVQHQETAA